MSGDASVTEDSNSCSFSTKYFTSDSVPVPLYIWQILISDMWYITTVEDDGSYISYANWQKVLGKLEIPPVICYM